jgi:hypothetical protein
MENIKNSERPLYVLQTETYSYPENREQTNMAPNPATKMEIR